MKEDFSLLPNHHRCWVISALGGEYTRVRNLHRKIAENFERGDLVIYLGNVFGSGEFNVQTLNEVLFFRRALLAIEGVQSSDVVFLKGSMEDLILKAMQLQFCPSPTAVLDWMIKQGLDAVLSSYGLTVHEALNESEKGPVALSYWTTAFKKAIFAHDGHRGYFASIKKAAYTQDKKMLFVHRGLKKDRPLSRQEEAFCWGGSLPFETEKGYDVFEKVIRTLPSTDQFGLYRYPHYWTLLSGGGLGGTIGALLIGSDYEYIQYLEA